MPLTYQPSKIWEKLSKKSSRFLDEFGYDNFKRTVGIVYNDYFFNYEKGVIVEDYADKLKETWDNLYKSYPNDYLDAFFEPKVGNPMAIEYRGRLVSFDLAASLIETALILTNIDIEGTKSIKEIGGGYGRLAYILGKIFDKANYALYDIEPSIGLSMRYLTDVLPDRRGFYFHTPDELKGDCDLLIAMDCLHEMTRDQVDDYFEYADRHAKYFYYSCWNKTRIHEDEIDWNKEDYPVRANWTPLYLGPHRMRNGFFEAFYKCR